MECGAEEVAGVSCARGGGGDPGAYAAVLKRKLDLYCAAVAKSMEINPQETSLVYPNSQASDTSQLVSQASFDGNGTVLQGKSANSCTSKELSDDDGDLEEITDPANAKRAKRMLSNRESARRSRKRKQAHQNDIESEVTQLRTENASLLKRLTDMTHKYKEATLGNRSLTVGITTMRRKVNIAEEAVRRITGTSLLFTTPDMPGIRSMPFPSCVSKAASTDAPIGEAASTDAPIGEASSTDASMDEHMSYLLGCLLEDQINSGIPDIATPEVPNEKQMDSRPTSSLQRVDSLENLQKRMYIHSETAPAFADSPRSSPVNTL